MEAKTTTKLGEYLQDKGISQTWLAKKLDVKPATVSRYCSGDIHLWPEQVKEISLILEVPESKIS